MKNLILGVDGYIGWSLAIYMASQGHRIFGIDNFSRRQRGHTAIPIADYEDRLAAFSENFGEDELWFSPTDMSNYTDVENLLKAIKPDTIIHLAQMPSAPYSMRSNWHCVETFANNVIGTLNLLYAMHKVWPTAHLVKLGTMGEYGTPNVDIGEGWLYVEQQDGRTDRLPFPRQPGSWYHATKVHDSVNIQLACKMWDLRCTDIMQGVVYGTSLVEMSNDERLFTRFDYDEAFGTVINRFCAQAVIGHPLTVYGKGDQTRSFLPLADSVRCINLLAENPPYAGEYRVVNQFDDITYINELARIVQGVAGGMNLDVAIAHLPNPRVEEEEHYYQVEAKVLSELGYVGRYEMDEVIHNMILDLIPYAHHIDPDLVKPTTNWRK